IHDHAFGMPRIRFNSDKLRYAQQVGAILKRVILRVGEVARQFTAERKRACTGASTQKGGALLFPDSLKQDLPGFFLKVDHTVNPNRLTSACEEQSRSFKMTACMRVAFAHGSS